MTLNKSICLLLAAVSFITPALAQSPADRIAAISKVSGVAGLSQNAWHLKADATIFDNAGKNPQQGTIEAWHSGSDLRIVYTFGATTEIEIRNGSNTFRSSGPALPYRAEEIFETIYHPGPNAEEIQRSTVTVEKRSFDKIPMECFMLTQPVKGLGVSPLGLYPTYCAQAGSNVLRGNFDFGSGNIVFNGLGQFLGQNIPTNFSITEDDKVIATAKVTALGTYVPQPAQFVVTQDMKPLRFAVISGEVAADNVFKKSTPKYPNKAPNSQKGGIVILKAVIGRDGHIHSLHVLQATNPEFAISAITSVRGWTYKPYLLNGEANEIATTIAINFQHDFSGVEEGGVRH